MRNIFVLLFCTIFFTSLLPAQNIRLITVKAGTRILDYFPLSERYLYPGFTDGKVVFNNGDISSSRLNYNFVPGEIEFIKATDTLAIVKKKDIRFVTIAQDTFLYDNGYIKILNSGQVQVGLKHYVIFKEVLKKGAYGTTTRGSSVDSYNSMAVGGSIYNLNPDEDIVLQDTKEFYISRQSSHFVLFRKKNVLQLFPEYAENIKNYLKNSKVDFDSADDLLRFSGFLSAQLKPSSL